MAGLEGQAWKHLVTPSPAFAHAPTWTWVSAFRSPPPGSPPRPEEMESPAPPTGPGGSG